MHLEQPLELSGVDRLDLGIVAVAAGEGCAVEVRQPLMKHDVHGDFLFVVCVDALILTQVGEGASKKCLVVLSKFYYARIKIIRILRYCFIYILLPDICRA